MFAVRKPVRWLLNISAAVLLLLTLTLTVGFEVTTAEVSPVQRA